MQSRQFAVRISFFEFYLDNIYDLIESDGRKLEVKETPDDGIHIKDAAEVPVKSIEELFAAVKMAISNRKTEETSIVRYFRSLEQKVLAQPRHHPDPGAAAVEREQGDQVPEGSAQDRGSGWE